MQMNRNCKHERISDILPGELVAMDRFWGGRFWHEAMFRPSAQRNLFGGEDMDKTENRDLVNAYCKRLNEVAGFGFVANPLAMRNSRNAIVLLFDIRRSKQDRVENRSRHLSQIRLSMGTPSALVSKLWNYCSILPPSPRLPPTL